MSQHRNGPRPKSWRDVVARPQPQPQPQQVHPEGAGLEITRQNEAGSTSRPLPGAGPGAQVRVDVNELQTFVFTAGAQPRGHQLTLRMNRTGARQVFDTLLAHLCLGPGAGPLEITLVGRLEDTTPGDGDYDNADDPSWGEPK